MTDKPWLDSAGGKKLDELIALERDYRVDSIVVAIEGELLGKSELTPAETVVVAVEAMEREVNNGGWAQFFTNSSYEHAPILVASLDQIGASQTAAIARRAMKELGASPEWHPGDYESAASGASDAVLEKLGECDSEYYGVTESIVDKLFDFIKRNREKINV